MNTKICSNCNIELNVDQFHKAKHHSDGLQSRCKQCQKEYHRQHYLNNKQKYVKKASVATNKKREFWKLFKTKLQCIRCGENHPACLDFHHRDASKKRFNVSYAMIRMNLKEVELEIEKCDVLCSNCHRKEHYNLGV